MKHTQTYSLFTTLALLFFASPLIAETQNKEKWFVVLNGEDRVGMMHTRTTVEGEQITTAQQVKLAIGRDGVEVRVTVESGFVETMKGEPVEATSVINMGGVPMKSRVEFVQEGIRFTAGQAGQEQTRVLPAIEGDWLTPAAAERAVAAQLAEGKEVIQVRTVDVSMGVQAITMTMRVKGREDVEVFGKTVPAVVWDATVSSAPGIVMREYVDEQGQSIQSVIEFAGMKLTIAEADEALAKSDLTPAEMIGSTLITPNKPINKPRRVRSATFVLKAKNGSMPELPQTATQSVTPMGKGEVRLHAEKEPAESEAMDAADIERYLEASAVLNHEDKAVSAVKNKLFSRMRVDPKNHRAIAEALRQHVHEYIEGKDLSVGFATASDVARTKQGDCTEHAVLLAAVLRSAGIPSRCVSGLVYADQFAGREGIFGYHMWTQAWIADEPGVLGQGRWMDFDATLPGGVRYDATHIALGISDMNGGLVGNDMAALVPLLGNLEIKVEQVQHAPAGADP